MKILTFSLLTLLVLPTVAFSAIHAQLRAINIDTSEVQTVEVQQGRVMLDSDSNETDGDPDQPINPEQSLVLRQSKIDK